MVIAVKQEIDYPIIDEEDVKKGMIRFGVGDANGIGAAESKSVCHGANIIPTDRLCSERGCAAFFVFSKKRPGLYFHPGPTSCVASATLRRRPGFVVYSLLATLMSPTLTTVCRTVHRSFLYPPSHLTVHRPPALHAINPVCRTILDRVELRPKNMKNITVAVSDNSYKTARLWAANSGTFGLSVRAARD